MRTAVQKTAALPLFVLQKHADKEKRFHQPSTSVPQGPTAKRPKIIPTRGSHDSESPNQKILCSNADPSREWHPLLSKAAIMYDALFGTLFIMADLYILLNN